MIKYGATTNYIYNDLNQLIKSTENKYGNETSQNFLGIDGNVIGTTRYSSEGFKYYTYNKDVQRSTTSVVGEDGKSTVAYDYDDFGVTTTIGDSSFFNEVCYTGGIYDVSTGLYYLNVRYYDPRNGRFITQDTYRGEVNNPSTLHLYAYCDNNPINYVDPSGHIAIRFGYGVLITIAKITTYVIVAGATYYYIKYVAKNLRKKKVGYYKAVLMYSLKLKRKEVFIGPHIKSHKAIQRVILNQSVWSTSEERAYNLAHSVTSREPLHHRDGDKKKQPGKYNHYHAKSKYIKFPAHIWY